MSQKTQHTARTQHAHTEVLANGEREKCVSYDLHSNAAGSVSHTIFLIFILMLLREKCVYLHSNAAEREANGVCWMYAHVRWQYRDKYKPTH